MGPFGTLTGHASGACAESMIPALRAGLSGYRTTITTRTPKAPETTENIRIR